MTCLIGISTAVQVSQVEPPNGSQGSFGADEPANGRGAANFYAEGIGIPGEVTDVFGPIDAFVEEGLVESLQVRRPVGREIRWVQDEPCPDAVAVGK